MLTVKKKRFLFLAQLNKISALLNSQHLDAFVYGCGCVKTMLYIQHELQRCKKVGGGLTAFVIVYCGVFQLSCTVLCSVCVCVCLALIPISCEMCVYTPCAKRNNIKTLLLFFSLEIYF